MIGQSPRQWVGYLMPEDGNVYKFVGPSNSSGSDLSHATKFELLMGETRAVLSRYNFMQLLLLLLQQLCHVIELGCTQVHVFASVFL